LEKQAVPVIRLEQLYPFPQRQLQKVLDRYQQAEEWIWVQEEPENMGGWQFVRHRLEDILGKPLGYIGRPASSSPATGFPAIYKQQQAAIIDDAMGEAPKEEKS
jgi:2-oxoglutarate dehydrogenase E1 component